MAQKVEPEKCIGIKTPMSDVAFTPFDACKYALGIGYSKDPFDENELSFTYELSDNFQVSPTITPLWCTFNPFEILLTTPGFPTFNAMNMVHGEHTTQLVKPINPSNSFCNQAEIADVTDKGKGALVDFLVRTYEKTDDGKVGDLVLVNNLSLFIRGIGGFGFKGKNTPEVIPNAPNSSPTKVLEQKTELNQALIYRLSGDFNPLHVDTNFAQAGGFDKPILHGLCTYGIAGKLIISAYCDNDSSRLKKIRARFTSHVFPGETLILKTWMQGSRVIMEGQTKERGKVVIVGFADIQPQQKL